ncbi:hypothetical protein GCM10009530_08220 [Microbispora corallina]|uniref:Uncharacterized protein n=1 Tax=Microbispora corallina TaxID=83302 RepID=A0ABQ4FVE2_9ACTN|nr:hypothetical protein [Microbispora corallina]GIH38785.1 hypothetical protein Mco01_17850 [Microbispora corallina]
MNRTAVLALAAAVTVTALPGVAQAEARTGAASATSLRTSASASSLRASASATSTKKTIRYAWVKSCKKKDYTVPCGPWTLTLRDGSRVPLKDARVFPLDGHKVDKESTAPLGVSGDGGSVAYFRASDNRIVVRDIRTNRVRVLPGAAARLPKGVGMSSADLQIDRTGRSVAVSYQADKPKPSLVADLTSGTVHTLRSDVNVQSFSPDGGHLLATRSTGENTTEFLVYDRDGHRTESRVVPQVVANNTPIALADDGASLALIITAPSGKQRLRVYDLAGDTVGDPVDVKVPKGESAYGMQWTSGDSLDLWETRSDKNGNTTGAIRRGLDPATGAAPKLDSFVITSKAWTWWLPGE